MINKLIKSPFVIKTKNAVGGVGFPKKEMVDNYFDRYKDRLKLIEIEKTDSQVIYYVEHIKGINYEKFKNL